MTFTVLFSGTCELQSGAWKGCPQALVVVNLRGEVDAVSQQS